MKKFFHGTIYETYHLTPQNAIDGINQVAPKNEFNLSQSEIKDLNNNLRKFLSRLGKVIKKIEYLENNLIVYKVVSGCVKREIFLYFKS